MAGRARTWPALVGAPMLALTHLSLAYALATPACAAQREALLHGLALGFLLLALACTLLAARALVAAAATPRERFLARVATGTGALSVLVIVALWIPPWWLSPCYS